MQALRISAVLVLLWLLNMPVLVAARSISLAEYPDFRMVGSGELTWWGMTVYRISLFSKSGAYQPDEPHVLKIDYEFSFSKQQLAESSAQQIAEINGSEEESPEQLALFRNIFIDVGEGDHIIGVHQPGTDAEFYSNGVLLGRIENASIANDFFRIWLDPDTGEPRLRKQLLGEM